MAVTDEQRRNPMVLGDTGMFERLAPPLKEEEKVWKIGKFFDILIKPFKHKCKNCGTVYSRLPTEKEFRFDCSKKGCYWMIFSDGSQTHDYPGE